MPAPRFQQMIEQLHATGLTYRQIAEAAKLSHSTVHRLATGEARARLLDGSPDRAAVRRKKLCFERGRPMSPRQMVADLRQWGIDTGMIAAGLRCGRTSVLNLARMDDAGGSAELVAKLERLWRRHRITSGAQDDRVATG